MVDGDSKFFENFICFEEVHVLFIYGTKNLL